MMNKKIFIAALALLALSCSKQQENVIKDGGSGPFVLSASLEETKSSLVCEDIDATQRVYKTVWNTDDKISVNGKLSNGVDSSHDGDKSVDFTFEGGITETSVYKVLYPGTTSQNTVTLPASRNYSDGMKLNVPAWGNASVSGARATVKLHNFCGVLRFALKGSATLDRIEINALGGEKICGSFTLAVNSSGFTGSFSGGDDTASTLTCDLNDLTLTGSDTYIYVPIPAQAYASGLEALVYQTDGAFMRLKFWGSGATLTGADIAEFESKTFAAGRTENIVTINSLTAEAGGEPTATPPGITVGVYNIKMAENRSGDNSTYISMDRADVQAGLGSSIAGMGADIFGINEIGEDNMPGQSHDVKAWAIAQGLSSSNYTWMMDYPNKVSRSGYLTNYSYSAEMYYANVFAYNKNTIVVEDDGYVWLCNDEDDYWSSMKNAYEHSTGRHTAVYALCRHKVSGKRFWFIVTHFDIYYGNDDGDNLNNVKSFKTFAQHLKNDVEDLPIIAVGDLNFGPKEQDKTTDCPNYGELTSYWTDAYDKVKADGNMTDYYKTYDGTQSGSQHSYYYPFITFTKNHPDRRLDHIVIKNSASHTVTPISYRTVRRTYVAEDDNTWCPSDHLPVVSYITFD